MKTIVIVDDTSEHINQMNTIIQQMNEKFQIKEYQDISQVLNDLHTFSSLTIFIIDIILGHQNGINLANDIIDKIKDAQIIFISSFLEKATDVYDVEHCYFVYKPEMSKRLSKAIKKAFENIELVHQELVLELKDRIEIIKTNEIKYLERDKRTTYIHCQNDTIKTSLKIKELLSLLPCMFIRCHNSYIVNLNQIKEYKRECFILNDKDLTVIPISRTYHQDVRDQFHKHILDKTVA